MPLFHDAGNDPQTVVNSPRFRGQLSRKYMAVEGIDFQRTCSRVVHFGIPRPGQLKSKNITGRDWHISTNSHLLRKVTRFFHVTYRVLDDLVLVLRRRSHVQYQILCLIYGLSSAFVRQPNCIGITNQSTVNVTLAASETSNTEQTDRRRVLVAATTQKQQFIINKYRP